jgi:WD40 repeat protein
VFSTSDDGTARIWNAETCAEEKSIRLRGPSALGTNGLAYLYDKGKIAVLELKTGETARTYPVSLPSVSIVTKVILGEKAHTLLVGTFTNGVAAIDLKSGAVRSLAKNQGSGSALEARNPAAIATDGRLFAYVRGVNGATGYIQDTQATKPHVLEFELSPQEVRSVDFVPDRPNVLIALTRTGAFSSSGATATAWLISGTP